MVDYAGMEAKHPYWREWSARCRRDLTKDIMPFWMTHGWDWKNGGVYTCLDRDMNVRGAHVFGWRQGMDVVSGGRDGAVRFVREGERDTYLFEARDGAMVPVQAQTGGPRFVASANPSARTGSCGCRSSGNRTFSAISVPHEGALPCFPW